MRFTFVALLTLLAVAQGARADAPYRVADLRERAQAVSSNPRFVATARGLAFFLVEKKPHQRALWRTDGTAAGTFALTEPVFGADARFVVSGDTLSFVHPWDGLWTSDGTVAGTGPGGGNEYEWDDELLVRRGDALFFLRTARRDLWVRDGAGERPLANVRTGPAGWTEAGVWNDGVFLATERGVWKSDGTAAGTTRLTNAAAWSAAVAGTRLFFLAEAQNTGLALWTSDGTAAGTIVVAPAIVPPPVSRTQAALASLGDRIVLVANGKILTSDGTSTGTRTLRTGRPSGSPRIAVLNGAGYFGFDDGALGLELWRSDGTEAGTQPVHDTTSGADGGTFHALTAAATRIYYFYAGGGSDSAARGFYVSDGTAVGTRLLQRGTCCGTIAIVGDTAYFPGQTFRDGIEPWVSDGTAAGTRLIANLSEEPLGSSNPRNFIAGATRMYFVADTDDDIAIWSVDAARGSSPPTVVARGPADAEPRMLGAIGDTLYYARRGEIRKTDGIDDTFVLHSSPYSWEPGGSTAGPDAAVDGRLLFYRFSDIWTTDGTAAGTAGLFHAYKGVRRPVAHAGRTWVYAEVLSTTDGTLAGTREVSFAQGIWYRLSPLIPLRGALYMVGSFGSNQTEARIWRFSGTPGDVSVVATFPYRTSWNDGANPAFIYASTTSAIFFYADGSLWHMDERHAPVRIQSFASAPASMTALGDRVVFAAGGSPWVSDGTAAGTKRLHSSDADGFFVADGVAYFSGTDRDHGRELWQTDGTVEGTRMVADLAPGPESSAPGGFARHGNVLSFAATTPEAGRELWAYPLPDAPAVTIDDARANESARKIAIPVRLTRASAWRVTVDYEMTDGTAAPGDYTATRGRLTFEPGETVKHVAVDIADDAAPGPTRAFLVHLKDATAPVERTTAAGIIEDDDQVADLGVSLEFGFSPTLTLRNAGPHAASSVRFCWGGPYEDRPHCSTSLTMEAGKTSEPYLEEWRVREATIQGFEADPNPANNTINYSMANDSLVVVPAVLRAGETGTVFIGSGLEKRVALESSDSSVVLVSRPVSGAPGQYATATFTARKPGKATIRLGDAWLSVTVHVIGAAEPIRLPATISRNATHDLRFGDSGEVEAYLYGVRANGAVPTGTLEMSVGSTFLGSRQVNGRETVRVSLPVLLPGTHEVRSRYSGDAHFLETTDVLEVTVAKGIASLRAIARDGMLAITVRGVLHHVPTGTITVGGQSYALVATGSSIGEAIAGPVPADAQTVTFSYSGDASYEASTVTIPIEGKRSRIVRR